MSMKRLMISKGGQISIPAEIRKRWRTRAVVAEDRGDELVLRPAPEDPINAARGALRGLGRSSSELRRIGRREDREIEKRRWGRSSTPTR